MGCVGVAGAISSISHCWSIQWSPQVYDLECRAGQRHRWWGGAQAHAGVARPFPCLARKMAGLAASLPHAVHSRCARGYTWPLQELEVTKKKIRNGRSRPACPWPDQNFQQPRIFLNSRFRWSVSAIRHWISSGFHRRIRQVWEEHPMDRSPSSRTIVGWIHERAAAVCAAVQHLPSGVRSCAWSWKH